MEEINGKDGLKSEKVDVLPDDVVHHSTMPDYVADETVLRNFKSQGRQRTNAKDCRKGNNFYQWKKYKNWRMYINQSIEDCKK